MFYNKNVFGVEASSSLFWASSVELIDGARKAWRMDFNIGNRLVHTVEYNANVLCIKR